MNSRQPDGEPEPRGARRRARAERESLAQVLDLVRRAGTATRQDLERLSGLGRAVVIDRLAILGERGYVEEGDLGLSTGGRAPRLVRFNATAGHLLLATLSTSTLSVGLTDLSGRLRFEHHEHADVTLGAEPLLERIGGLFDWILTEHASVGPIWGIGLALPSPVEHASGRLDSRPVVRLLPGWDGYPVAERLARQFGAPVLVDNDVHMMALGELRVGQGADTSELVFVKIGMGVGAGICLEGRLYRGSRGYAGDIGHVAVSDDDVVCRCGNRGCLEAVAGAAAIARAGHLLASKGQSPFLAEVLAAGRAVTSADVGMAAQRGDPRCIELLTRSGRLIGETLATVVAVHNPSLVVVGGGVAQAGEILVSAIREAVYRRSRSLATRDLRIVGSDMGKSGGLVGTAIALADELFAWEYLRSWIDLGSPVALAAAEPESASAPLPPAVDHHRRGGGIARRGRRERSESS